MKKSLLAAVEDLFSHLIFLFFFKQKESFNVQNGVFWLKNPMEKIWQLLTKLCSLAQKHILKILCQSCLVLQIDEYPT